MYYSLMFNIAFPFVLYIATLTNSPEQQYKQVFSGKFIVPSGNGNVAVWHLFLYPHTSQSVFVRLIHTIVLAFLSSRLDILAWSASYLHASILKHIIHSSSRESLRYLIISPLYQQHLICHVYY